jgi:hypothetical protein
MTSAKTRLRCQAIIRRIYKQTRYRWSKGGALPSPKSIIEKICKEHSIVPKETNEFKEALYGEDLTKLTKFLNEEDKGEL